MSSWTMYFTKPRNIQGCSLTNFTAQRFATIEKIVLHECHSALVNTCKWLDNFWDEEEDFSKWKRQDGSIRDPESNSFSNHVKWCFTLLESILHVLGILWNVVNANQLHTSPPTRTHNCNQMVQAWLSCSIPGKCNKVSRISLQPLWLACYRVLQLINLAKMELCGLNRLL